MILAIGSVAMERQENKARFSGLSLRVISGVVLASLVLAVLWAGGFLFALLVVLAALQMLREWDGLTENEEAIWRFAGLFYVAIPCACLLWLRSQDIALVFYILFVVWTTDIGAYFSGRIVGGAKLAPAISPNKTWAGLGGGMTSAGIVGGLSHLFSPYPLTIWGAILLGMVLAFLAQISDLFESWLKRQAGVKDSSSLIPGHGGLLDRVDGLIFTLPFFALLVYIGAK
jgi:phosphatidate cytidylyltransferase